MHGIFRGLRPVLTNRSAVSHLSRSPQLALRCSISISVRERRKSLLDALEQFLDLSKDQHRVSAFLNKALDDSQDTRASGQHIPSRQWLIEKVISYVFRRHLFDAVATLYDRMLREGLVLSPEGAPYVLAARFAPGSAPQDVDQREHLVEAILSRPDFKESHLIRLLDLLSSFQDLPPECPGHLVDLYISKRAGEYVPSQKLIAKLVDVQVERGDMDAALGTVTRFELNDDPVSWSFPTPAWSYSRILHAAAESGSPSTESTQAVLSSMTDRDVPVDVHVFNGLIHQELARRSPKAFSFYAVLKQLSTTTSMKPNNLTFRLLFRSLAQIYRPRKYVRLGPSTHQIVPPRTLFRELESTYLSVSGHPRGSLRVVRKRLVQTDRALLQEALVAFLASRDYPGAYLVIQAMAMHGVDVDARACSSVLHHVVQRTCFEVRRSPQKLTRWMVAFGFSEPPVSRNMQLEGKVAALVSEMIRQPVFIFSKLGSRRPLPELSLIVEGNDIRVVETDKSLLLHTLRILHRAMVAELTSRSVHKDEKGQTYQEQDLAYREKKRAYRAKKLAYREKRQSYLEIKRVRLDRKQARHEKNQTSKQAYLERRLSANEVEQAHRDRGQAYSDKIQANYARKVHSHICRVIATARKLMFPPGAVPFTWADSAKFRRFA